MGQNKLNSQSKSTLLWCIVSGVGMFLLGYFTPMALKNAWHYNNEISFADIVNILATCSVTLFAAWYIAKRLNEDRYAKELSIEDLKTIETTISSIVTLAQSSDTEEHAKILPSIHILHGQLNRLDKTCSINSHKIPVEKIRNRFYCFYGCATNFGDHSYDPSPIVTSGDDLIVEIRKTILKINSL